MLVHMDGPPGTSLAEMDRITARVGRDLRAIDGVRSVGSHAGRAVSGDQVVDVNSSELWVGIDRGANYDSTLTSIEQAVREYPGLHGTVETYSSDRVQEELTGAEDDVVVKIFGENQSILADRARAVRSAIAGIDGISNARVDSPAEQPTLQIEVDLDAARRHGIKPGDVRRATAALLAGIQVGSLFEEQKVFDVVVWGTPGTRANLAAIRNLVIDTPERGHVRLADVAKVRIVPGLNAIEREAVSRRINVLAHVSGRDRDDVVSDVDAAISGVSFPLEYHAETIGKSGQPVWRLLSIALAALVGIVLLLQARFGSWGLAFGFAALLPAGVSGAFVAALVTGGTMTLASWIGVFTVFGLCVRWGIGVVNDLRRAELAGAVRGPELAKAGGGEALAPTLTAALVMVAAVLPAVVLGSEQGLELLHPLAVVLVGGIATASALTLLVVPALYLLLAPHPAAEREAARETSRRSILAVLTPSAVAARRQYAVLRRRGTPAGGEAPSREEASEAADSELEIP